MPKIPEDLYKGLQWGGGGASTAVLLVWLLGGIEPPDSRVVASLEKRLTNHEALLNTHQKVLVDHGTEFAAMRNQMYGLEQDYRVFASAGERFTREDGKKLEEFLMNIKQEMTKVDKRYDRLLDWYTAHVLTTGNNHEKNIHP